jgi:hypothetical protein
MAEQHSPIIEFPRRGTAAVGCAIRPKAKPSIFIDARCAAGGWIAATLGKCSTMRGHYLIQPKIGADTV